ncbi:MAG: alkylmercury lyase family protein [Gemmatimonadaceae bacterium]|nr:alkylmercury lyase family protein [Gemmatimonadaceae bacterium]
MPLTPGVVHATIARHFLSHGTAPSIAVLAETLGVAVAVMAEALRALADDHGVVLHPVSGEIWAMHPFSAAPTAFWVESGGRGWWGNCAWCSLGIVALLRADATITTSLGGECTQVVLQVRDGAVTPAGYCVHFPIPMARAWDNVTYTCSTMLVFASSSAVDAWCARHAMPRGDVQALDVVWAFAQAWYGRHLDPTWTKWTTEEARTLFDRFGFTGPTWALPVTEERF